MPATMTQGFKANPGLQFANAFSVTTKPKRRKSQDRRPDDPNSSFPQVKSTDLKSFATNRSLVVFSI
jgi:hypothetical protein